MEWISLVFSIVAIIIGIMALRKKDPPVYKSGVYHFDDNHEAKATRRRNG